MSPDRRFGRRILGQGAIPILIFSIQSGLYAPNPVIRAVVNDSPPDRRPSQSFPAGSVP
jgi:hypothetical protein